MQRPPAQLAVIPQTTVGYSARDMVAGKNKDYAKAVPFPSMLKTALLDLQDPHKTIK